MARFFGRYEHSIDPKGRIILPSKFRPSFKGGGYLTQFHDRCLALWTPEDFDSQMEQAAKSQTDSRESRNIARLWARGSQEVEIDKQGRMAIPVFLREYARLDGEISIHGAIDRIELWNPIIWEEKVAEAQAELASDDMPSKNPDLINRTPGDEV